MEAVKSFVQSSPYDALLNRMRRRGYQINDAVPTALYAYETTRLRAAGVNFESLFKILSEDERSVAEYAFLKEQQVRGDPNDQERSAGEEIDPDDRDEIVATLPYYRSFMLGNIIEYYILKESPDFMDVYLKTLRTPGAKKYARQIASIYRRVREGG